MGLNRIRVDSIQELKKQKTPAQLQKENEELREKVIALESQLDSTNLALCDVYEQLLSVASAGEV